jgi:transcriptional regulator with XRE-family HTH domain
MPKKLSTTEQVPTLVRERLTVWGKCISAQRRRQRIPAADLSARLGVSRTTLFRLENGDPGAGIGAYLTAMLVLGILDQAAPPLAHDLWQGDLGTRVKLNNEEKGAADDEYF